jgi:hypothetical protein
LSNNTILATAPLTTTNFILKATGTTIGNSLIFDNGTNVGIGTSSPANLLHLAGTSATPSLRLSSSANTAFYWDIGRENASTGDFVFNNAVGASSTERMRITAAGNVGIATTPSTWDTTVFKGLQIANSNAFIVGRVDAASQLQIGTNAYYNADGNWKFIQNGYATRYIQNSGVHSWEYSSASGTAGNNVTFNEAMRITSGGIVEFSAFTRSLLYQIYQGGTFRGGLYNYANASGAGSDYSPTLVSETSLYFCTNGDATKRLTISTTGAATFSSTISASGTQYLGAGFAVSNDSASTIRQAASGVADFGGSTVTFDLASIFPRLTFTNRGLSVTLQLVAVPTYTITSSAFVVLGRTGNSNVWSNVILANININGVAVNSVSASGTVITVVYSTTISGTAYINVATIG